MPEMRTFTVMIPENHHPFVISLGHDLLTDVSGDLDAEETVRKLGRHLLDRQMERYFDDRRS
jgi:hypothetical protein